MSNEAPTRQPAGAPAARPLRTLVVDDSLVALTTMCAVLEASGAFEIAGVARDGREAVAQVEALRPALVVMDLQMPGMNGLQATELIRRASPATRVVVVSVLDGEGLMAHSREAGAHAFVAKSRVAEELPRLVPHLFHPPTSA